MPILIDKNNQPKFNASKPNITTPIAKDGTNNPIKKPKTIKIIPPNMPITLA